MFSSDLLVSSIHWFNARHRGARQIASAFDNGLVVFFNSVLKTVLFNATPPPPASLLITPTKTTPWDLPGTPTLPTGGYSAPIALYIISLSMVLLTCLALFGVVRKFLGPQGRPNVAGPEPDPLNSVHTPDSTLALLNFEAVLHPELPSYDIPGMLKTALPDFQAVLHPELPRYDIPGMLKTALPGPRVFQDVNTCLKFSTDGGFWNCRNWRLVKTIGIRRINPLLFRPLQHLGSGGFGSVAKVELGPRGTTFAIKRIKKRGPEEDQKLSDIWDIFWSEVDAHVTMKDNPAFPKVYGVWHDAECYYFAMDCAEQCIFDVNMSAYANPRRTAMDFSAQLILAIHALHKRGILHMDIKLENLLLSSSDSVVITDFGVACNFAPPPEGQFLAWHTLKEGGTDQFPPLWPDPGNPHTLSDMAHCGTPLYQAPSVKLNHSVSYGADLWAVGMVIHYWMTNEMPNFNDKYEWVPESRRQQSTIEVDFFQRFFSFERPRRYENYSEIKEHAFWRTSTSSWTWAELEDDLRERA